MPKYDLKPDEVLYNSLVDGCSKCSRVDLAFDIYHQMMEDGIKPSTITFNSLIDACVRSNQISRGWQILKEMEQVSVQADNYTYSTLFKGIKEAAELDTAISIYDQIPQKGLFQADEILFNVLLDACITCR